MSQTPFNSFTKIYNILLACFVFVSLSLCCLLFYQRAKHVFSGFRLLERL